MATLTKKERRRIFKAIEPAYYEGFYDHLNHLPDRLQHIARDVLNVAEQEPWRPWSDVLNEVLSY